MIKRLSHALGSDTQSDKYTLTSNISVVGFTSEQPQCIVDALVEGCTNEDYESRTISGLGHVTEDGVSLKVRLHGETFLDAYELIRIMQELGSPCYGGEYDADHFIIRPYNGPCNITSPYHMRTGSSVYTFECDALILNDLGAAKLASGLFFNYTEYGESAISLSSGLPGLRRISGLTTTADVYSISAKPVQNNIDLIIPYESLRMYEGKGKSVPPYVGSTTEFKLTGPLYALNSAAVFDTLNLISGFVTRAVGVFTFDENTSIFNGKYEGIDCKYVELPIEARGSSGIQSTFFANNRDDPYSSWLIISPDGTKAFFGLGYDVDGCDELVERGVNFAYALKNSYKEQTGTQLPQSTVTGQQYIEVCDPSQPYVMVKYIE